MIYVAQVAAQLRLLFDEEDLEVLPRELEGGRHAGEAAADDEGCLVDADGDLFEGLDVVRVRYRHPDEGLRLFRGVLLVFHMDPGALVADIGHLEEVLVEARLADGRPEEELVRPRRAGGNDHPVKVVLR